MCSPDGDIYTECIAGTEDIIEVYSLDLAGTVPGGVTASGRDVYRFADFDNLRGARGAAAIREGITDASLRRARDMPAAVPDPSEAEAEAFAVTFEQAIAPTSGLFGSALAAVAATPAVAPPAGGLPAGVTFGV